MIWVLFIVVAVLLIGGFAALISGRIGYDPLSEPTTTQSDPGLREEFAAREIASVRFDTALRGYRMDQVDRVLDRLQDRIAELEAREADFREPAAQPTVPATEGAVGASEHPQPTPDHP